MAVGRPRSGGQVAAVNARAAGRVGDHGAVAKQLAEQPQIGRLAATGARPGKLKKGLQELDILDVVKLEPVGHWVESRAG